MPEPIPSDLAKGFDDAVLAYEVWHPDHEGRQIKIRGSYFSIAQVCDLVDQFADPLPTHVFDKLRSYMHDHPDGESIADLEASRTYGRGAIALRTMIARRSRR
jgi:hypothetical protein